MIIEARADGLSQPIDDTEQLGHLVVRRLDRFTRGYIELSGIVPIISGYNYSREDGELTFFKYSIDTTNPAEVALAVNQVNIIRRLLTNGRANKELEDTLKWVLNIQ